MKSFNINSFIKSESFYSSKDNFGNYSGAGFKIQGSNGSVESLLAVKPTNNSIGGFGEFKYTSPKILNSNWSLESRTRAIANKKQDGQNIDFSLTQRVAAKGAWNINDNWNIYEIAGLNLKVPLNKNDMVSLTPTSITGVGYNINDKLSSYAEVEVSNNSPTVYLGCKYNF